MEGGGDPDSPRNPPLVIVNVSMKSCNASPGNLKFLGFTNVICLVSSPWIGAPYRSSYGISWFSILRYRYIMVWWFGLNTFLVVIHANIMKWSLSTFSTTTIVYITAYDIQYLIIIHRPSRPTVRSPSDHHAARFSCKGAIAHVGGGCFGARSDARVRELSSPSWHLMDLINYARDTVL